MTGVPLQSPSESHSTARFDGGWFEMGNDDGAPAESPRHRRFIGSFELDRDLVTNADFEAFVAETGYRTEAEHAGGAWGYDGDRFGFIGGLSWASYASPSRSRHPVVGVAWADCAAYARWAGKRLPSEAEWEFAARAIAGGDEFDWLRDPDLSLHCGAGRGWDEGPATSPVGRHDPTGRVRDLVGNVWQWCADDYSPTAYADHVAGRAPAAADPALPLKVRRGGAWNVRQAFRLRCANRGAYRADRSAPNLGFRCAR